MISLTNQFIINKLISINRKLKILNKGNVEQTAIKREICDVMEGSEQAFNMRSKRYEEIG